MKNNVIIIMLTFILLFIFPITIIQKVIADEDLTEREKYLRQFAKDSSAVKSDKDFKEKLVAKEKNQDARLPGHGTLQVRDIPNGTSNSNYSENNFSDDSDEGITSEDRKRLQELTQNALKQAEGAKSGKISVEELKKMQESLKNGGVLGIPGLGGSSNSDMKLSQMAELVTKNMSAMSEPEIVIMLQTRFKSGVTGSLMRNPKISTFVAKIMRDSKALPSMAKISENKKMLMVYGSFILVTFFIGYLLKRFMNAFEVTGPMSVIKRFLFRFTLMTSLRFGSFIWLFRKDLGPTWDIAKSHFF